MRTGRNCGAKGIGISAVLLLAGLILLLVGESPAHATFLKNGIRAGDRSKLYIVRPPQPGGRGKLRVRGSVRGIKPKPPKQRHKWFWTLIDPKQTAAAAERWGDVIETLKTRRRDHSALYAAETLGAIARDWRVPIAIAARDNKVSEALILAVIAVESAGKEKATSLKGASGLMQLIPATAKRFGVTDIYDPGQNIAAGTAYLSFLLDYFEGDVVLALAGYNAGENAVAKHAGVPPYAETRDYVVKVIDALVAAEKLCILPVEGPRRSCLWNLRAGLS